MAMLSLSYAILQQTNVLPHELLKFSAIIIDHDLQLMDLVSDSMVIFEGTSSVEGIATSPMPKKHAMNRFLESLDISFRKDDKTSRHRVNKEASRLDKEQKSSGNYYFMH